MKTNLNFWVLLSIGFVSPVLAQLSDQTVRYDELDRSYTLYVPEGYQDGESYPLIINMHGLGSNRFEQMTLSQMNEVAEQNGFLVAYPDAIASDWTRIGDDNVGFISAAIDDIHQDFSIDLTRVYATGLSQGGAMSYVLASQLTDRVAAIAPVGAVLLNREFGTAPAFPALPNRPIPLLHTHGTNDNTIPYEGGDTVFGNFPSAQESLDVWAENNQCSNSPVVTELPNANTTDNSTVSQFRYTDCKTYTNQAGELQSVDVMHFRINGGGHTWPGDFMGWPASLGTVNRDINASQEIWNFFSHHSMPASVAGLSCDFNADSRCSVDDVDAMTAAIIQSKTDEQFDLNGDSIINIADLSEWLSRAATENGFSEPYFLGDADLDGSVNAADLNSLALNWRESTNIWSDGDFNADGMVDAGDLNSLALNWRDSMSSAAKVSAVPEPSTYMLFLIGLLYTSQRFHRSITGPVA